MSEMHSFHFNAARFVIAKDAELLIAMTRDPVLEHVRPNMLLALMPYISMFVDGSFTWIRMRMPDSEDVTYTHRYFVERTRQHAKLMLDTERSIDDLILLYRDLIRGTHAELHAPHKGLWAWLQHRLQKDLGLYFLNDEFLSSTHIAALNSGLYEMALKEGDATYLDRGDRTYDVSVEIGRYTVSVLHRLGHPIVLDFPDAEPILPHLTYKDVRASKFYADVERRTSTSDQGLAPLMIHLISLVNSVRLLLPMLETIHPFAVTKWKFLAAFHLLKNLQLVQARHYKGDPLLDGTIEVIRGILGDEDSESLLGWSALRNMLVHYDIKGKILMPDVLDYDGHAIIEAYLGSDSSFDVYAGKVDRVLRMIADCLVSLLIPSRYFKYRQRF